MDDSADDYLTKD